MNIHVVYFPIQDITYVNTKEILMRINRQWKSALKNEVDNRKCIINTAKSNGVVNKKNDTINMFNF